MRDGPRPHRVRSPGLFYRFSDLLFKRASAHFCDHGLDYVDELMREQQQQQQQQLFVEQEQVFIEQLERKQFLERSLRFGHIRLSTMQEKGWWCPVQSNQRIHFPKLIAGHA